MEFLSEIVSFIVGALSGGLAVHLKINGGSKNQVRQARNVVKGDMAGRDMTKKD